MKGDRLFSPNNHSNTDVIYLGRSGSISSIAKSVGISRCKAWFRYKSGMSIDRVFSKEDLRHKK